ncbi:DUF2254 domain-containing protein [Streptomyces sp. NBC_00080]|uniref:hypothetical protein n=1 Tax=Streptomyces sp. NBC_00080 TaxID=2975645 RepID=UPI00324FD7B1
MLSGRSWEDYLELAVTEIRDYGATSVQVCRRLRALFEGLLASLPAACGPALHAELRLLDEAVEREFADDLRRAEARTADSQGIGGRRTRDAAPGGAPPDEPGP